MRSILRDQKGTILMTFGLLFVMLIGLVALGIEAGRWYLVKAELSKAVDAAALAGARNISNPNVDAVALSKEVGRENFPVGYMGTPNSGAGAVAFDAVVEPSGRMRVAGRVSAVAILAQLFGVTKVSTGSTGVAKKQDVEIMLVLDRTGSMNTSNKIGALKTAASSFVDNFKDTQAEDKMGLISFAVTVRVDRRLDINYVTDMKSAIGAMNATGGTNMEDALDQADGPKGLTDQTGLPVDKKVAQFVIFFSDGMPTAFSGTFKKANKVYDGAAVIWGDTVNHPNAVNCRPAPGEEKEMFVFLQPPDVENVRVFELNYTGDGLPTGGSRCDSVIKLDTTKWDIFYAPPPGGPVPGFAPDTCVIPYGNVALHTCRLARNMTLDRAQALKDKGIKIYVIGLGTGTEIDSAFLTQISSGTDFTYITPNKSDLESIFNTIAKDIKLRLVE